MRNTQIHHTAPGRTPDATSRSSMQAVTRTVLDISCHWLEVGSKAPIHKPETLNPAEIMAALTTGKTVIWQDWTLRATPPRRHINENGVEEWAPAIWVSATQGFSPFPHVDPKSVHDACRYIQVREARARAMSLIEFDEEPCY